MWFGRAAAPAAALGLELDLYRYASKLEFGQSVGGDDGFVLVLPSERNRRYRRYMSEYRQP